MSIASMSLTDKICKMVVAVIDKNIPRFKAMANTVFNNDVIAKDLKI